MKNSTTMIILLIIVLLGTVRFNNRRFVATQGNRPVGNNYGYYYKDFYKDSVWVSTDGGATWKYYTQTDTISFLTP